MTNMTSIDDDNHKLNHHNHHHQQEQQQQLPANLAANSHTQTIPCNDHQEEDHPHTDGGYQKDNDEGEENEERDPLLTQDIKDRDSEGKSILLTPAMEEEILGPESFTTCGVGRLTSQGLQKLARPETYLIVFSLAAFAQGIFFTYSTGTLSTVERRFKLPSSVSGFINTGNDILQIFLSLPLAYAAGYGHRPRWLAGGLLLSAGGSFLIMTPHIIFGAGDYSVLALAQSDFANDTSNINKEWDYCGKEAETESSCIEGSAAVGTEQYTVAALQFLGQALSGLANVCFYVVGYSYLDEAVSKEKVPFYFAVSGCMRIFGPVVGTALASFTVSVWVELGVEPVIKQSHPHWVGAWWLGYPVIMLALGLSCMPMMMMPRQLPGARERTLTRLRAAAKKGKEAFQAYKDSLRPLGRMNYKDMFQGIVRLSKNKIFLILSANQTIFWFGVVGYFMFQLKYMENQFKITASESNKTMALVGMLASIIGWLGTGSLLTIIKPSTKIILYITMGISLLCMVSYSIQMNISCERDHVIGLDAVFQMVAEENGVDEAFGAKSYPHKDNAVMTRCMSACNCTSKYSPVCVNGSHLFFSPCHAGCKEQFTINGTLVYENCSCTDVLSTEYQEQKDSEAGMEVKSGMCSTGCDNFIYYVVVKIFTQMLISGNRVIANIIFFRSVNEKDKDLALGILNLILSLAFSCVPIFVGSLIDYTCVLWQRTCGRRGYCYLYDMDKYMWILHGIPAVAMFLSFVTESMLLWNHKDIDFFGHKEMEQLELLDIIKSKATEKMKRSKKKEEFCK